MVDPRRLSKQAPTRSNSAARTNRRNRTLPRPLAFTAVLLVLVGGSAFAFKTWLDRRPQLQTELASVYLGASRAEVIALKGMPIKETQDGTETLLSYLSNDAFTFVYLTHDAVTKISMGCHGQSDDNLNGIVCGDSSADVLRRLGEPSGILPHRKDSLRSFYYRDLQINLILKNGIVDVLEVMDTGT